MSEISNNQFSKETISVGSNSFASELTASSNAFERVDFTLGQNPWEGDNTASSAYGNEDVFGGPDSSYGNDEAYGGISHFKLREDYTPSH